MTPGPSTEPTPFDWFQKARSRLWSKKQPNLRAVRPLPLLIGTFFYAGLSPFASGTVGSLVAAALYYFIPDLQHPLTLLIACVVVLVAGVWSGGIIERQLNVQDPGIVVIDEVLGQWVAILCYVLLSVLIGGSEELNTDEIVLAFLFFRIFDIIKLPPARYFERRHGGLGIMLDDVVAGLYAAITLFILVTITAFFLALRA
ncbi:MAG TPA: phosphatidylglycerophosphatase A [Candidatus Kapabacteria bacterium]|nr:phosphatidylglycerophosphatase A [Candidatus Kapabacteria bacterium]